MELNARLDDLDEQTRETHVVERSIELVLTDLDRALRGDLHKGQIINLNELEVGVLPKTDLRLSMSSDDFLALIEGSLGFPGAWASGRIRLDASISDLWRLRKLL